MRDRDLSARIRKSSLSAAAADYLRKPRVGTDDGVESTFYWAAYAFVKFVGAGHHFGSCASKMLGRKSCPRERRELPCRKNKFRPAWNLSCRLQTSLVTSHRSRWTILPYDRRARDSGKV